MPNFNLVIDTSNFKPFDINPALQVLHDYRDAYYRLEDQINKIAEEKGEYVLPESSKYRGVMDRYNSDFNSAVQDFTQGMNLRNASAIRNLRRRYSSEITPIRTMVENYNKYNDKLTALGPDAIVGATYGVDDFYGGVNPQIDYRSAKQVELDATKYFSGINSALTQDPEFKSILGGQYFQQVQRGGLDSGAALQAALVEYNNRTNGRHSEAVQNLLDHMQNVMDAQGVESFSDEAKQRVWNRVAAGLINSIEAPKYSHVGNRGYESPQDRASRLRRQARMDAEMESKGYIYKDGKYVYDEHTALTRGVDNEPVTTPDGTTWTYNRTDKKWHPSEGSNKAPMTDAALNAEIRRQITDQRKAEQADTKTGLWKRTGQAQTLSPESYLTLGQSFQPFEFEMDDYTGSDDEKEVRASGFNLVSNGGRGFNGASSGKNFNGISLAEADIPASTKMQILQEAQRQIKNLTLQDLVLYVDQDYFSDDHIRVCINGTGEGGNYTGRVLEEGNPIEREYEDSKGLN